MAKFFMSSLPWAEDAKEISVDIDFRAKYLVGSQIMEYRLINKYFPVKARQAMNLVSLTAANCMPNKNDRFVQNFISSECVFVSRNIHEE
jgi:hypothetical protein